MSVGSKQGDLPTMEFGSPEWIETSLARLDDLERERGQHEEAIETSDDPAALKQHTAALDRLDAEIKSLYAQLEAVAEDDEDGDEDDEATAEVAPPITQGDDELSAPHFAATTAGTAAATNTPEVVAETLASAAGNPFGSPSPSPAGGGGGFDAPAPMSYDDDDLKPKGAGGKWVFLGVVLVAAAGIGGFFAWQNIQANKPKEQGPTEPQRVIKAAEVPDDTEAPKAAQSGNATISPNANPAANNSGNTKKKKKKEEKKSKPIELKGGDGPL
ncbi:hypothetical protein ENSA5_20870 [Enhygromyxa salina]|uniref:Transmembrane protein n=1 Tax=Enhygromyxa salina TaxID=215803 RepID=A0A2S9YCB0_9BACT|nr:hypothetical protein [Enhygromyxa salina]PRQ02735.1 hypothetical protein ENSA5_20870 [Enhygromyxa salina]